MNNFDDLVSKYINYIKEKILKLIQVGRIAIDGYDAGLGPHVDRDDKCISNVLYLAPLTHCEYGFNLSPIKI